MFPWMFLRGQKATFIAFIGLKINFRGDYHISSQVLHCGVRSRGKDQIEGERSLCWLLIKNAVLQYAQ